MRPAKLDAAVQPDMFRKTLEASSIPGTNCWSWAGAIDWDRLDAACGDDIHRPVGRPGCPPG